jgi:hypothetical protein
MPMAAVRSHSQLRQRGPQMRTGYFFRGLKIDSVGVTVFGEPETLGVAV